MTGVSSVLSFTTLDEVREHFPGFKEVKDIKAVFWSGEITDRKLSLLDKQLLSVVGFSPNGNPGNTDLIIVDSEGNFRPVKPQNFTDARGLLNELKVN